MKSLVSGFRNLVSGFRNQATAGNRPIIKEGQNTMTSRIKDQEKNTYRVLSTSGPNQPGPSEQRAYLNPLPSGELCYGPRDSSKRGSSRIEHNVTYGILFPTPLKCYHFVSSPLLQGVPPENTAYQRKLKVASSKTRDLYTSPFRAQSRTHKHGGIQP